MIAVAYNVTMDNRIIRTEHIVVIVLYNLCRHLKTLIGHLVVTALHVIGHKRAESNVPQVLLISLGNIIEGIGVNANYPGKELGIFAIFLRLRFISADETYDKADNTKNTNYSK